MWKTSLDLEESYSGGVTDAPAAAATGILSDHCLSLTLHLSRLCIPHVVQFYYGENLNYGDMLSSQGQY